MDQKKALLVVLSLVAVSLGLRAVWPMLARFDGSSGAAALGRTRVEMETFGDELTELRLADLELSTAEYRPGRDPFRFEVKKAPPPKAAPPKPPPQRGPPRRRPAPRPNAGEPAAPQPPPVDVKYLGSFGPDSGKIAVFGDGTDIYNVRKGDILKDHFIVESINYESADLKFVNFPQLPATRLAAGE